MSVAPYARVLRMHWRLAVASAALGGLLLGIVALRQPVLYRADLRLVASVGPVASAVPGDPYHDPVLTESRVRAYAQKVTSAAVLQPVITELHLPYSPDGLAGRVIASTPFDTTAIEVAVLDTDARRAVLIDNAIARQLHTLAATENSPAPLIFEIDRPAAVPTRPVRQFPLGYVFGGLLGGLLIGLGLALGLHLRPVPGRIAAAPSAPDLATLTGIGYESDFAA